MKARPEIYRTRFLFEHANPKQRRLATPFAPQSATRWECVVSPGNSAFCAKGGGQR